MGGVISNQLGLGGVSTMFPVGTFVRVSRKLTEAEFNAAEKNENSCKWNSRMDNIVGHIGIVIGGGVDEKLDSATVAFCILNDATMGNWWNFQNSWLEQESDVPKETEVWLRNYMMEAMRNSIADQFKMTLCRSHLGDVRTIVKLLLANLNLKRRCGGCLRWTRL